MTRRSLSTSPSPPPRAPKRARTERVLTPDDYKNGVVLAPMVRSGALPTRLFALKYGASLVWGPEMVDKAILHAERTVDERTGTIVYRGAGKPMFTTHPIEKPYFIYQIGSADPELAVKAAKFVMQDVSGIDLNCGCPKPFSTHAGMGAALLTNPDLLCSILTALRRELPPEISISAKIRLLPSQEDTLKLVERIVNTGVNALTVHCRTRNMRPRERALIERLREIVEFVERLGKGTAVIANGDCTSFEDAKRVREVTGAHSVMIATAAEANPSVFSPTPLQHVDRTLIPPYVRLSRWLDNHWSNTAFCIRQFKSPHPGVSKAEYMARSEMVRVAKSYDDMDGYVDGQWDGEAVFRDIEDTLSHRPDWVSWWDVKRPGKVDLGSLVSEQRASAQDPELTAPEPALLTETSSLPTTPPDFRPNPEPVDLWAPRPSEGNPIPALVAGRDEPTPTPGGEVGGIVAV